MDVNSSKSFVEVMSNQADIVSPILISKVPDKRKHILKNDTVLILDLQDADGNQIPANSRVYIGGKKPIPTWPTDIDDKSYRPYHQINSNAGVSAQYDNSNQSQLKISVDNMAGGYEFLEGQEIHIWLESPTVVDWDNSVIEFEVDEKPYRER